MEPISKVNLERITNGIYAFTMTLMIRNIQTPAPGSITSGVALEHYLTTVTYSMIDFVGAFLILGMFWLFYFQMFHRMRTFDFRFLYLHLVSLMVVVFVPFTQSFAAQNTIVPVADVLFQINYLILAILLTWQWHYARKHPELLMPELGDYEARYLAKKFLIPLGVAILGIIFIGAGAGYIDILYLLPFVILAVFMRHGPERIKPAEGTPEQKKAEESR